MPPQINRVMTPAEWAMLATLSVLWGGSFLFVGLAVKELPPLTVVLARVLIATVVLHIVVRAMGLPLPRSWHIWGAFFLMATINNVIPFASIGWAQTQIPSGLAAILNGTAPFFTVIVAHFFTSDEKMTGNRLAGVLVGMLGVAWMIGFDALRGLGTNIPGQLAMLCATLSYGFAAVFGRIFHRMGVKPLMTATGLLTASTVIMIPLALAIDRPWTLSMPSSTVIEAIVALAVVSTAFAYLLFFRILGSAGATNMQLVTFLIPVSAILFGAVFLHERLHINHFVGMAVIGIGLALIDGRVLKWLRPKAA